MDIAAIRRDYSMSTLDEGVAGNDPIRFCHKWLQEAEQAAVSELTAMTLATVDEQGKPHARIVLLKDLDDKGFVFFTNYESAKGNDLAVNTAAALVFFWKELERQVRIEGRAEKVTDAESEAYFNSRPQGSKIGAWASPQSRVVDNRGVLEAKAEALISQFGDKEIPRPDFWGGFRVIPEKIEFWQGRPNRLHDRILFTKAGSKWQQCRLAP